MEDGLLLNEQIHEENREMEKHLIEDAKHVAKKMGLSYVIMR